MEAPDPRWGELVPRAGQQDGADGARGLVAREVGEPDS